MRVIFYDLETTGFRPCSIMQIHMIGVDTDAANPNLLEFAHLINPGDVIINPRVPHQLTIEHTRDSPRFDEISDELVEFIDGAMLVGFNNHTFDDRVLQDAFGKGLKEFIHSSHDILSLMGRGISQNRALEEQNLMNPRPHDAKYDVMSLIALVNSLELGENLPEECSTAARSLVELLDMTEFNQPTAEDIPNYNDSLVDDDGRITFGIYAGQSLESVRVTDPWFANWLVHFMA